MTKLNIDAAVSRTEAFFFLKPRTEANGAAGAICRDSNVVTWEHLWLFFTGFQIPLAWNL
jgi:hypothetical protein